MMSFEDRQVEIKRLLEENKDILATPLMSEGNISPYQVGMMSEHQKIKWQNNAQSKMEIESRIRQLSRTDEDLQEEETRIKTKETKSRIESIDNLITMMSRFKGKRGAILPKYQKEIKKLQDERDQLTIKS